MRLFETTITPTMLYGCASWTITQDLIAKLVRTQRRMLRLIVGTKRRRTITPTHPPSAATTIGHDLPHYYTKQRPLGSVATIRQTRPNYCRHNHRQLTHLDMGRCILSTRMEMDRTHCKPTTRVMVLRCYRCLRKKRLPP